MTAGDATAEELLTDHLRADAELVKRVLPDLSAEVRAVVAKLTAADCRAPEASADELPPLLVDPPWARTKLETQAGRPQGPGRPRRTGHGLGTR